MRSIEACCNTDYASCCVCHSCCMLTQCQGCVCAEAGSIQMRIRRHTQPAARAEGEQRPLTRSRLCHARSLMSPRVACVTPAACSHGVRAASVLTAGADRTRIGRHTQHACGSSRMRAPALHTSTPMSRAHSIRLVCVLLILIYALTLLVVHASLLCCICCHARPQIMLESLSKFSPSYTLLYPLTLP